MNVLVYRPDVPGSVDRNGDPVDADGNVIRQESTGTYIGTLSGVVLADPAVQLLQTGTDTDSAAGRPTGRGTDANVTAMVAAPVGAAITLQHGDLIVTDQGISYALWGPRYSQANAITGQPVKVKGVQYYWLRATSTV